MMLSDTLHIAAAGLRAQGDRLRVISENIANADSTAREPGQDPYRRKLVTFKSALDESLGVNTVRVGDRTTDKSDFNRKFAPNHPAADAQGYILTSNVNPIVEMMDMREARRGYEANLSVVETTRSMLQRTLDILR